MRTLTWLYVASSRASQETTASDEIHERRRRQPVLKWDHGRNLHGVLVKKARASNARLMSLS
jgi:hypothetical protein